MTQATPPSVGDALYRQIVDSAVDTAMISTTEDGLVITWSEGAFHITGWTEHEMRGRSLAALFTPEDRAAGRPEREMLVARETGRASDMRWHLRKDGSRFFAHGSITLLTGPVKGYLKSFRDATRQHEAERAHKEARDRLELTLANAQIVGTWEWDITDDIVHADERCARLHSVDPESAALGTPGGEFMSNLHPEDRERIIADTRRAVQTGEALSAEYRLMQPGRPVLHVLARGRCEVDGGRVVRMSGVVIDITEKKQTETALRVAEQRLLLLNQLLERRVEESTRELQYSETRFRAYFNASPEYLYLLRLTPDDRMVFEDVNPAGAALYGLSRADIIGRTPQEIGDRQTAETVNANSRLSLRSGCTLRYEMKGGAESRPATAINTIIAPVEITEGGGLVLVCGRDLSEQRQAEEALRQSQKMEAIGQLTGGIAHDFNNLLAGVMGALEVMQARISQGRPEDLGRYIVAAQGAAKRAAALTHRLLAFSRMQTLSPELTDVNRLVLGMEDLVRRTIGPQIELTVYDSPGLWASFVDQNQLENALLNLCINARDAMPDGGRLTVESSNRVLDERAARELDLAPGEYIALCVSDTGIGMTADVIARAFDPFFTTKPSGSGTGLGLSMIYGFARQSGGQVRIDSQPGQGAQVCLYLPRHPGEGAPAREPPGAGQAPRAQPGESVLVVDDEPTVRMLVTEVLQELGYAAIEAADGGSGLKVLRSGARIDLLVTDVGLPGGMNGRQLADAARTARPELKVLFITGYAENAAIDHGHLEPGMEIMIKPFTMEALGRKIREIIEAG